jgi:hypothetical protein
MNVVQQPTHGVVKPRLRVREVKMQRLSGVNCVGKRLRSMEMIYQSQRGYHGSDSFSIEVMNLNGTRYRDDFEITVQ